MPQVTYKCPHCHKEAGTIVREKHLPACYFCHGILPKVPKGFCKTCFKPIPKGWRGAHC